MLLIFELYGAAPVDLATSEGALAPVVFDGKKGLKASSGAYNAVFVFNVLGGVPSWRHVVEEIARVLEPGGHLFFEELAATVPRSRRPRKPSAASFDEAELTAELRRHGLTMESGPTVHEAFARQFRGVAVKEAP